MPHTSVRTSHTMAFTGLSCARGKAALGTAGPRRQAVLTHARRFSDSLDGGPPRRSRYNQARGYVEERDRDAAVAGVSKKFGLGGEGS